MPELRATFTADDTQLSSKIGKLETSFGRLGRLAVGAFSVGAIVGFGREIKATADAIADVSDATGVPAATIQSLRALGAEAGVAGEKLEQVINRLTSAHVEAISDPAGNAAKQFSKLGISVSRLESMSPEQAIEAIGRAVSSAGNDSEKLAAATDLVGVRSKRMLVVLRQLGSEGIASVNSRMREMGEVMSDSVTSGLGEAGDKVEAFGRKLKNLGAAILFGWGKITGLISEKTGADLDIEAQGLDAVARARRAREMRAMNEDAMQRGYGPIWDKFEAPTVSVAQRKMSEAAQALQTKQSMSMAGVSDALVRIGGGRGVDISSPELQTLKSIDAGIKRLGAKPEGLKW